MVKEAALSLESRFACPDPLYDGLLWAERWPQAATCIGGVFVLNRDWAVAAALVWGAISASAQTPKADAPAKPEVAAKSEAAAKADAAAEAAAAMERAKRQAAGPMRVILEASKSRRKVGEAEVPAAAETSSVRTVATRSASPAAAQAEPAARTAAPGVQTQALATAAAPPAVAMPSPSAASVQTPLQAPVPAAVQAPAPFVAQLKLSSQSLQDKAATAPVAGLENFGSAMPGSEVAVATPVMPALNAGPVKPKLVLRVDPDVPQRLLDELGRGAVVPVDLTIRADGTVAAVSVQGVMPRGMQRSLAVALEQWRFDPLPAQRVHRVELVFNAE